MKINRFCSKRVDIGIIDHTYRSQEYHKTAHSHVEPAFNPSHAAIKISINATAAEFICKNIFPTPVQIKKL